VTGPAWRRGTRAILAVALAAPGIAGRADVFSPGELARAHRNLEGLASCTKCHVAGEQLAPGPCLECHRELTGRIEAGRGLHGRIPAAERACERCHHEHQGRDFALIDWGRGGRKGFDHARTGFELRGKHRRTDCARCHDRRLVREPLLVEMLAKQPGRETWLGAPARCAPCHFDEHRGQVSEECGRCHGEDRWKPARLFDHARTAYKLDGKHRRVACEKCHRTEPDGVARSASPGQTPPRSASAFVRYRGMPFGACTDCHKDPHLGRFGERCAGCHVTADWKKIVGGGRQTAFHEKTRYPLRGAHVETRCDACHGPFPGGKARYRGIPFERCTDCHLDAHVGQLAAVPARTGSPAAAARGCEACHGLEAWIPARYEEADHERIAYRLQGGHRAVACALCHPQDPRLERRVPPAARRQVESQNRPLKVSLAVLRIPKSSDCLTCHRDPHAGQFERWAPAGGCSACHGVDSFRKVRFDHTRGSRYPLEGKHAPAACETCHRPDASGVVRYRPLAMACAACHTDVHAGQFAATVPGNDCARCHVARGWKELRFRHEPPFTRYELAGMHRKVACDRCHGSVRVAGQEVRRYRPVSSECEACHADAHRGAFASFAPALPPGASRRDAVRPAGRPDLSLRPAGAASPGATRCAPCHGVEAWDRVSFDHARTGFPLDGGHRAAGCKACHAGAAFRAPLPRACFGCHEDVHAGRLGRRCERCHQAASWAATTFDGDAHRRSAFPLSGRHGFTPCDSCHGDRRDRGFGRPTRECLACHQADWERASTGAAAVDHAAPGFPRTCQGCHGSWRFAPASLPAHEACFSIRSGPHAGIRCLDCHTSLPPADYTQPFTCTSGTADCIRCHSCAEHEPVAGFTCTNSRCYECHRFAEATGTAPGGSRGGFR
jgi:hypothetical protein